MTRVFAVIAALTLMAPVPRMAQAQGTPGALSDLAWLTGCWEGIVDGNQYYEHWMKPAGDAMMGVSQTVARGKTTEYEFLQIRQETGGVFYVSKPSGQSEASFRLIEHGADHAAFENLDHDFPQRIIYRMKAPSVLAARIEGIQNGTSKGFDFPMTRARCD